MATSRLSLVSRARYTSPIPPLPRRAVISSEPSRVPTSNDTGISVEMQIAFGIMTRSDKVSKLKEASIQVWTKTVFMRLQGAVHMLGKPRTLHFELTAATLLRETDWIGIGAA